MLVTYAQQPQGGRVQEVPTGVECPNEKCEWFNPRAKRRKGEALAREAES